MALGRGGGRFAGRAAGPLVVLSLVNLIDQVDVSILRGVLPQLEDEFDLLDWQLGALGFAFVFINAIATIPAGWAADRVNRRSLIGGTLLSWSALSALAAAAQTYVQLFGARAMLGFGQAIDDPASTALLADYYPAEVRGRVFSYQQLATFLGGGLGLGLGGWIGATWGWRWAFLLVGTPGSLIAFAVFRLREPRRGEADGIEMEEPPKIPVRELARTATRSLIADMRMIFGIRTMRYVLVGVSTLLFTVSGVGYWLAVYHDRYSGLSEAQATGVSAGVLAIAGIIGTFWGGRAADKVFGVSPAGRITQVSDAIMVCAGLFLVSFLVPIVPAADPAAVRRCPVDRQRVPGAARLDDGRHPRAGSRRELVCLCAHLDPVRDRAGTAVRRLAVGPDRRARLRVLPGHAAGVRGFADPAARQGHDRRGCGCDHGVPCRAGR